MLELSDNGSAFDSLDLNFFVKDHLDEAGLVFQSSELFKQLSELPRLPLDVEVLSQIVPSFHDVFGLFVLVNLALMVEQNKV